MLDRLPTLLLIPHADAGDRTKWTDDQDVRPLSELGRRQAAHLAGIVGRVDAIFSSPARRCVETVEPIASASGVDVELRDELRELTSVTEHQGWDPWEPGPTWRAQLIVAGALGRVGRTLAEVGDAFGPSARVVLSAHGDLVPMLACLAAGYFGVPGPPPVQRGGCYLVDGSDPSGALRAVGGLTPPRQ